MTLSEVYDRIRIHLQAGILKSPTHTSGGRTRYFESLEYLNFSFSLSLTHLFS